MDSVTPAAAPIGYRIVLDPAAWTRIRLDEHAEADVRALLDTAFADVPEDEAAAARQQLASRFALQIAAARGRSGLDLYIPADPAHRHAGAFVVLAAEVTIPTSAPLNPVDLVVKVAAGNPAARTGVIGGSPAVRIDNAAVLDADGQEPANRRVEYIVAVPHDAQNRWLSLALTAAGGANAGAADVDRVVAGFDQAVAALEW
jgi:hypothetical protein